MELENYFYLSTSTPVLDKVYCTEMCIVYRCTNIVLTVGGILVYSLCDERSM